MDRTLSEVTQGHVALAAFDANALVGGKTTSLKGSVIKELQQRGHFVTSDVDSLIAYLKAFNK